LLVFIGLPVSVYPYYVPVPHAVLLYYVYNCVCSAQFINSVSVLSKIFEWTTVQLLSVYNVFVCGI